jgi:sulfur-oxidizing protein SoxZ
MRLRATVDKDGVTEVRVLITHPFENGLRKQDGKPIPAKFVKVMQVRLGETVLAQVRMSGGVSADPIVSVKFTGPKPGDRLMVVLEDNQGEKSSDSVLVAE